MRYKFFGETTGLRVSECALGAGEFGTAWGYGAEPAEARRMLDGYLEAGGNFVDTADSYQFGESETPPGRVPRRAPQRTSCSRRSTRFGTRPQGGVLDVGNSRRIMVQAVEQSLKRLRTDRIDLYWVHMPDGVTPTEESFAGSTISRALARSSMRGCRTFRPGAWRERQRSPNCAGPCPSPDLQIEYSLVERTPDRELAADGAVRSGSAPSHGRLSAAGCSPENTGEGERGPGHDLEEPRSTSRTMPRKTAMLDALERRRRRRRAPAQGQVAIAWIIGARA